MLVGLGAHASLLGVLPFWRPSPGRVSFETIEWERDVGDAMFSSCGHLHLA